MSDHYVHIEISVVGPGHAKIGDTVVMQRIKAKEACAQDLACYVEIELQRLGFTIKPKSTCEPASDRAETSLDGVA